MKDNMEINKETALRLWTIQFGHVNKAIDFAGREMAKAAYNDRNSNFGWNVDHILPQSRNGKTADYNLICCHMLTNDEKSDKFPVFTANNKTFEIQKRQNHYEIFKKDTKSSAKSKTKTSKKINLFDAAQGISFLENCSRDFKTMYIGYVYIQVEFKDNDFLDINSFYKFLREIFGNNIFIKTNGSYYPNRSYTVVILESPSYHKKEAQNLLDNCILLNTYASYFRHAEICDIKIYCDMVECDSIENSADLINDIIQSKPHFSSYNMLIGKFVKEHTEANNSITENNNIYFCTNGYEYNRIYTKLNEDLERLL